MLSQQKVQSMADSRIDFEMTFYPPANHRYDDDNLVGRMKAARDQIAKFVGVDDRVFSLGRPVIAEKEPPFGRVEITLRPAVVSVPLRGIIKV